MSKTRTKSSPVALPGSKEELLQLIDKWPYDARIEYAAKMGRHHRESPQFLELVKQLLDLPKPELPDKFRDAESDLLPQQRTTAKHHVEYQMAITALAAAGTYGFPLLKQELHSPSILMKNLIVREVTKLETNDSELAKEIMASVPYMRKKLISAALEQGRHSLLDQLLPLVKSQHGVDQAASFLHGCSRPVVQSLLYSKEYLKAPTVNWKQLSKRFGDLILKKIRSSLSKFTQPKGWISGRAKVWNRWKSRSDTWNTLLENHKYSEEILQMLTEYPPLTWLTDEHPESLTPSEVSEYLEPACNDYGWDVLHKHFAKKHSAKYFALLRSWVVKPEKCEELVYVFPSALNNIYSPSVFDLWEYILEKFPIDALQISSNETCDFIEKIITAKRFSSPPALKKLTQAISKFYKRVNQPERNLSYGNPHRPWIKLLSITKDVIQSKISALKDPKAIVDLSSYEYPLKVFLEEEYPAVIQHLNLTSTYYRSEYNVDLLQYFPALLPTSLEKLKPLLDTLETHTNEEIIRAVWNKLFSTASLAFKNEHLSKEQRDVAARFCGDLANSIAERTKNIASWREYRIEITSKLLTDEQKMKQYTSYTDDDIKYLANSNPELLKRILDEVNEEGLERARKIIFGEGNCKKTTRDAFMGYIDITDSKQRNLLQKATDSNSSADREAAINTLLKATFKANSIQQTLRTLKYLRTRLKNESIDMRTSGLEAIVSSAKDLNNSNHYHRLFPSGITSTQLEIWFQILQDALESSDAEFDGTSAISRLFSKLSQTAIMNGALSTDRNDAEVFFNFGVEIQWRIITFSQGAKKGSQSFKINISGKKATKLRHHFKSHPETLKPFTELFLNAYRQRINESVPDWEKTFNYLKDLYTVAGKKNWQSIPVLATLPETLATQVESECKKDSDGLYIIEGDHPIIHLFWHLQQMHQSKKVEKNNWDKVEPIARIFQLLIHSRQLPKILFLWLKLLETRAKTKDEKIKAREFVVTETLKLTPSAIYVKFVWRFLLSRRQDLLDQFIDQKKSFRGVFFVPPEDRDTDIKALIKAKQPAKRTNNRFSRNKPKAPTIKKRRPQTQVAANVEEQISDEAQMQSEIVGDDHHDFFSLQACYGLHRLLPRQLAGLSEEKKRQILSVNRSIPERVAAAIRFCLLPTTTYIDVLHFLDLNDPSVLSQSPNNTDEGEETTKLPVNISDALVQGMMQNDEPFAALNFLFSAAFLGSEKGKISVYAASQALKYMPDEGLYKTFSSVLSGKKRNLLKITTYKEVVRLLLATPSTKHVDLLKIEWNRKDLHRDVRIAILQGAFGLLNSANARYSDAAWQMIELASNSSNPEVLLALLGVDQSRVSFSGLFQRPRLEEFMKQLKDVSISDENASRYVKNVVLKLAKSPPTTVEKGETKEDDDVRHLAIASLKSWLKRVDISLEAAEILSKALAEYYEQLQDEKAREFDRKLALARWESIIPALYFACGVDRQQNNGFTVADKTVVVNAITDICTKLANPLTLSHSLRPALWSALETLVDNLPERYLKCYTEEEEEQLFGPIRQLGGSFVLTGIQRKFNALPLKSADHTTCLLQSIHELLVYFIDNPDTRTYQTVVDTISSLVSAVSNIQDRQTIFDRMINNQLTNDDSSHCTDASYKAILQLSALSVLKANITGSNCNNIITLTRQLLDNPEMNTPSIVETITSVVQQYITAFFPSSPSTMPSYEETQKPCGVADLVEFIALLPFDETAHINTALKIRIVLELLNKKPDFFILCASHFLCRLLDLVIYAHASNTNITNVAPRIISEIVVRVTQEENRIAILEAVYSSSLRTADPLPKTYGAAPTIVFQPDDSYGLSVSQEALDCVYQKFGWSLLTNDSLRAISISSCTQTYYFINWVLISTVNGTQPLNSNVIDVWEPLVDWASDHKQNEASNVIDFVHHLLAGTQIEKIHPRQQPLTEHQREKLDYLYSYIAVEILSAAGPQFSKNKDKESTLKFAWRPEFVQQVEQLMNHSNSLIREKASRLNLTSKSAEGSLHRERSRPTRGRGGFRRRGGVRRTTERWEAASSSWD